MRTTLFILVCTFILQACDAQQPVKLIQHSKTQNTIFLDSVGAAGKVVVDRMDLFFDKVGPVEMSIQMKMPLDSTMTRSQLLSRYMGFLQTDMTSFSAAESNWIADIMRDVYSTCQSVAPDIYPDSLFMMKTHGRHYGDGVYYTRENCIVIPADVLRKKDRSAFKSTMYHEIFHVYSRLHPAKSAQLYKLIGFEPIGFKNLRMPAPLAERALFNPDGVDFAQKITLTTEKGGFMFAIPIIYANERGFVKGKNEFFGYLEFSLFEVRLKPDGTWHVETMTDGLSPTINMGKVPDFFRQIRDNTGYIIHPDEVLADNFSFIMLDKDGKKASYKFSKEGKALLVDVEAILKK
jgi:hypothetical protein